MRYEKKDRTKILVLIVALVALWVFIGLRFTVLSKDKKAKEAARARRQAEAQQAKAGDPARASGKMSPTLRLAALMAPVDPPKDDPFRPVIPPRRHGQAVEPTVQPRPEPSTPDDSPPLPPPPDSRRGRDTLQVTGIILGSPSTAVLRVGDEHYVVRAGDLLDSQLRVQEITKDTVTLRDGRTTYVLRLGR